MVWKWCINIQIIVYIYLYSHITNWLRVCCIVTSLVHACEDNEVWHSHSPAVHPFTHWQHLLHTHAHTNALMLPIWVGMCVEWKRQDWLLFCSVTEMLFSNELILQQQCHVVAVKHAGLYQYLTHTHTSLHLTQANHGGGQNVICCVRLSHIISTDFMIKKNTNEDTMPCQFNVCHDFFYSIAILDSGKMWR